MRPPSDTRIVCSGANAGLESELHGHIYRPKPTARSRQSYSQGGMIPTQLRDPVILRYAIFPAISPPPSNGSRGLESLGSWGQRRAYSYSPLGRRPLGTLSRRLWTSIITHAQKYRLLRRWGFHIELGSVSGCNPPNRASSMETGHEPSCTENLRGPEGNRSATAARIGR